MRRNQILFLDDQGYGKIIKKVSDNKLKLYSLYCNPNKDKKTMVFPSNIAMEEWLISKIDITFIFYTVKELAEYVLDSRVLKHALIEFMKAKAKKIEEETGIDDYFTPKDELEIISWGGKSMDKIYAEIKNNIWEYNACGLDDSTCPFCIKYSEICDNCGYGDRHGICNFFENNNTWSNVIRKLDGDEEEILTNEFYWGILR